MNWLKMIGAAGQTLENDWLQDRYDVARRIRFAKNKRPSGVSRGDKLVLYAAGWERIFAIAVVKSDHPLEDGVEERWPWGLDVRIPIAVPRLDEAPSLGDLGVASTSVRQQSHIKISDETYQRAIDLLIRDVQP